VRDLLDGQLRSAKANVCFGRIVIFEKSGCAGLRRKLVSSWINALGTASTTVLPAAIQASPRAWVDLGGGGRPSNPAARASKKGPATFV
jgi:hypothetical protein